MGYRFLKYQKMDVLNTNRSQPHCRIIHEFYVQTFGLQSIAFFGKHPYDKQNKEETERIALEEISSYVADFVEKPYQFTDRAIARKNGIYAYLILQDPNIKANSTTNGK